MKKDIQKIEFLNILSRTTAPAAITKKNYQKKYFRMNNEKQK